MSGSTEQKDTAPINWHAYRIPRGKIGMAWHTWGILPCMSNGRLPSGKPFPSEWSARWPRFEAAVERLRALGWDGPLEDVAVPAECFDPDERRRYVMVGAALGEADLMVGDRPIPGWERHAIPLDVPAPRLELVT